MPTKNCEMGPGQLFIVGPDGEKSVIEGISDLTVIDYDVGKESLHVLIQGICECTFTGTIKTNRKALLRVVLGKSNNWLKMHGYPMVRGRFLK